MKPAKLTRSGKFRKGDMVVVSFGLDGTKMLVRLKSDLTLNVQGRPGYYWQDRKGRLYAFAYERYVRGAWIVGRHLGGSTFARRRYFVSQKAAEDYISKREKRDPKGVHRGDYYIDNVRGGE